MPDAPLRIALVYDVFEAFPWRPGDPPDADAEYEPWETVESIERALRLLGHEPIRVGTAHDLLAALPLLRADCGLSIAEGARGPNREGYAPTLFEMAGIPFLGSDALTLSLSLDKVWTKHVVAAAGVRVPEHRVFAHPGAIRPGDLPPFPLFVKPRFEGSAKGITAASKVESVAALGRQVAWCAATYGQDALAEAFVEGTEFTVAVVGHAPARALPALQRAVEAETGIGLHALERRGLAEKAHAYHVESVLTPALEARLHADALAAFDALRCRDFARVDFRVAPDGTPFFLEINPLPTFAPDGTFAIVAELMGQSYPDFLAGVLAEGLQRLGVGG